MNKQKRRFRLVSPKRIIGPSVTIYPSWYSGKTGVGGWKQNGGGKGVYCKLYRFIGTYNVPVCYELFVVAMRSRFPLSHFYVVYASWFLLCVSPLEHCDIIVHYRDTLYDSLETRVESDSTCAHVLEVITIDLRNRLLTNMFQLYKYIYIVHTT